MSDELSRVRERLEDLQTYDHCDLTWRSYGVSGGEFHLRIAHRVHGIADLCLLYTKFIDCPRAMRDVRFRLATEAEQAELSGRVPPKDRDLYEPEYDIDCLPWNPRHSQLILEFEGGRGVIWAGDVFITPGEELHLRWANESSVELTTLRHIRCSSTGETG